MAVISCSWKVAATLVTGHPRRGADASQCGRGGMRILAVRSVGEDKAMDLVPI